MNLRRIGIGCMVVSWLLLAAAGVANAACPPTAHASPAQRTCRAFAAWDRDRTTGRLDAMVTASLRAPWEPLGADVTVIYTEVRTGNAFDLPTDIKGLRDDCRRYEKQS